MAADVRLTRVYVDARLEAGGSFALPPDTGAHLAKVLRARSGDPIVLFSGDGREYTGAIESVRGSKVTASVGRGAAVDRESALRITLIQSVPRGDRMDFIVQKATELGVSRMVPVLSQRCVVRLDAAQSASKAAHWRAVIVGACEQCGRNRLPSLEPTQPLLTYLGAAPDPGAGNVRLVLDPEAAETDLPPMEGGAEIAIGPEGGFADEELEAFGIAGYARVRLGPRILRTETAAIAAITWLQSRFGDMR